MAADCEELTFDFVDDVCLALQENSIDIASVPPTSAIKMGPLIELYHFASGVKPALKIPVNVPNSMHSLLQSVRRFRTDIDQSSSAGFVRAQDLIDDDLLWTDFTIRAKRAASSSGLSNDIGGRIVAAVMELYSNIVEHSEHVGTGYVAYSASEKYFEFLVADRGIGVLNSLRKNINFTHLNDYEEALKLAISENVSRFEAADRGFGFRPIFVGLANMSDLVRFRSGDCAYIWERASDRTIGAKTVQLARMSGFLCYVRCSRS